MEASTRVHVSKALGEWGSDYDVTALIAAFRDAVRECLPEGFILAGSDIYGPWGTDLPVREVRHTVACIDFWELVKAYEIERAADGRMVRVGPYAVMRDSDGALFHVALSVEGEAGLTYVGRASDQPEALDLIRSHRMRERLRARMS